jgi:hypothetical protein
MKYLLLFKSDVDEVPACKQLAEMAPLVDELKKSGVLLSTEGLHPTNRGAKVRLAGGKLSATDGPFAEAKEIVAGYVLVNVRSKAEAVELAGRFLAVAGQGWGEVREVIE